jgi:hypothetical protein
MLKVDDLIYCKKTFKPSTNYIFEKGKYYIIHKFLTYDCVDVISLSLDPWARYIFKTDLESIYVANEYLWDYFITEEQRKQQIRKEKLKNINNSNGRQISYM